MNVPPLRIIFAFYIYGIYNIYTCNFCVEIINYLHRKNSMVNRQIIYIGKLIGSWIRTGVYYEILFEVKLD